MVWTGWQLAATETASNLQYKRDCRQRPSYKGDVPSLAWVLGSTGLATCMIAWRSWPGPDRLHDTIITKVWRSTSTTATTITTTCTTSTTTMTSCIIAGLRCRPSSLIVVIMELSSSPFRQPLLLRGGPTQTTSMRTSASHASAKCGMAVPCDNRLVVIITTTVIGKQHSY